MLSLSVKTSFTNIRSFPSNFFKCEYFLESNSTEILALCEKNLDDTTDSGNFSMRGYLSLIRKDSVTHMHGLAIYVKEGLPFAWDLFLENSADSDFVFDWLYLLECFPSFSTIDHLCHLYVRFLIPFRLTYMRFSANAFTFGDFNVHRKDWLTYSGGTDRPGDLYNFFVSQMTLLGLLTFLLGSSTVTLTVLLFWIYFFLLTLVFVLQWLSLYWEILIMWLSEFPSTLRQTQNRMSCFIA